MALTIGYDGLVAMLLAAVEEVKQNHKYLSELDSHGGDGDHGTTMVRAMDIVAKAVADCPERVMKRLLADVGWAVMGVDGGATGPLLGTLFMSMADATAGKEELNASDLAAMFEAGLAGVQKRTKAQVGDKTMMDALVPAVAGMRAAAHADGDISGVLNKGAEASAQGAASTTELQARFGRAKNIGEKSVGAQDAGATSISLIFRGFSKGVE